MLDVNQKGITWIDIPLIINKMTPVPINKQPNIRNRRAAPKKRNNNLGMAKSPVM